MITRAKILKLPSGTVINEYGVEVPSNYFTIEIPIFKPAGQPNDLPTSAYIQQATLCYNPGVENGYRVGDIVYVDFYNNEMNEPVIIGKLYTKNSSSQTSTILGENLSISKKVELPNDAKSGDYEIGNELAKLNAWVNGITSGDKHLFLYYAYSILDTDNKYSNTCLFLLSSCNNLQEIINTRGYEPFILSFNYYNKDGNAIQYSVGVQKLQVVTQSNEQVLQVKYTYSRNTGGYFDDTINIPSLYRIF